MVKQTIQEKIKQRRRQMLVHSYLYYEKNENIVSDSKWSQWAMELVQLQKGYPKEASEVEFAEMFKDWDGNSGAGLSYPISIINTANYILNNVHKFEKVMPKPVNQVLNVSNKPVKVASGTKSLF